MHQQVYEPSAAQISRRWHIQPVLRIERKAALLAESATAEDPSGQGLAER